MKITIEKITPVREGEAVLLKITLTDGINVEQTGGEIASDLFFDMGFPMSAGDGIEISREKYEAREDATALTPAIKKGAELIGFAQNTKKGLVSKLIHRGFSKDISSRAADYLENVGYIDERTQAEQLCSELAERRLYGKSRIKNELYGKGFSDEAINAAMQLELDFDAICAERIEKTVNISDFADKVKCRKTVASLMRYGFSVQNIKNALVILKNE